MEVYEKLFDEMQGNANNFTWLAIDIRLSILSVGYGYTKYSKKGGSQ